MIRKILLLCILISFSHFSYGQSKIIGKLYSDLPVRTNDSRVTYHRTYIYFIDETHVVYFVSDILDCGSVLKRLNKGKITGDTITYKIDAEGNLSFVYYWKYPNQNIVDTYEGKITDNNYECKVNTMNLNNKEINFDVTSKFFSCTGY